MPEPLISIIIPTFNAQQFIAETLDSILHQSYQNFEILVIDDGSRDQTEAIVSSYKARDSRIHFYSVGFNSTRPAVPRNIGLRQAKGELIAFIDADDLWLQEKLKNQVDAFGRDQDIGLVFCAFRVKQDGGANDGKIIRPKNQHIGGFIYEELLMSNFITASSAIVQASVLKEVGHFDEDPKYQFSEDYDLWLRIARVRKIVYIPQVLGIYRMHVSNSNTSSSRLKRALNVIDKNLACGWAAPGLIKRSKANYYFREGWFLIPTDVKLARSYLCKALGLNSFNIKILVVSLLGLLLSLFPSFVRFIQSKKLDKKLGSLILNPQNL